MVFSFFISFRLRKARSSLVIASLPDVEEVCVILTEVASVVVYHWKSIAGGNFVRTTNYLILVDLDYVVVDI